MGTNPHIALLHHNEVPAGLLDEFCIRVKVDNLKFERVSQPDPGPQMGIEWLAFPAIAVLLLKSYFDSFMKEAGKDHYQLLKRALIAFWGKLFSKDQRFRVAIVTSSGVKKLKYSVLFAIYAAIDDGKMVKLLIPEEFSEEEYSASIEAFLDFVESYHSGKPRNELALDLNPAKGIGNIILVAYDEESKSLLNVDIRPRSDV
ncbi:MAG: hypothetical protein OXQ86_00075 [Gammaproteobacteria bacterium]|nr:hypothetical protein [Gammaproteobacteria bacterium]